MLLIQADMMAAVRSVRDAPKQLPSQTEVGGEEPEHGGRPLDCQTKHICQVAWQLPASACWNATACHTWEAVVKEEVAARAAVLAARGEAEARARAVGAAATVVVEMAVEREGERAAEREVGRAAAAGTVVEVVTEAMEKAVVGSSTWASDMHPPPVTHSTGPLL